MSADGTAPAAQLDAPVAGPAAPPAEQPKKQRAPLDPAARAKAAERAAVRRVLGKAKDAKTEAELWKVLEAQAAKQGRKLDAPAPAAPAPAPAEPQKKGAITEEKLKAAAPLAEQLLSVLRDVSKGTRYEGPSQAAYGDDKGEGSPLRPSLVATLAKYDLEDLPPEWALVFTALLLFGPTAFTHAREALPGLVAKVKELRAGEVEKKSEGGGDAA